MIKLFLRLVRLQANSQNELNGEKQWYWLCRVLCESLEDENPKIYEDAGFFYSVRGVSNDANDLKPA